MTFSEHKKLNNYVLGKLQKTFYINEIQESFKKLFLKIPSLPSMKNFKKGATVYTGV